MASSATRNEILYLLNKPDDFILAMVEFQIEDAHRAHYVQRSGYRAVGCAEERSASFEYTHARDVPPIVGTSYELARRTLSLTFSTQLKNR